MKDHTELFKQFSDNDSFRSWLASSVFAITYEEPLAMDRTELGRSYLDRVTRDRELTAEDEGLLRSLLGRD
jgi:hypothetical protein